MSVRERLSWWFRHRVLGWHEFEEIERGPAGWSTGFAVVECADCEERRLRLIESDPATGETRVTEFDTDAIVVGDDLVDEEGQP